MIGPLPDPPEPLDDDEWAAVSALAAVSPSPEVEVALQEVVDHAAEFDYAVRMYEQAEADPTFLAKEKKPPGLVMHDVRLGAIAAISRAERIMRDELASL